MRDILLTLIIAGAIPFILKRPYIGILMWVWIGVFNPQELAFGYAATIPWAAIVAGATLIGLVITKDPKRLPFNGLILVFMAFVLWMNLTALNALHPELVSFQWTRVMKMMLMIFVAAMLIKTKQQVQLLIGVLLFSLAFYGVKGGFFTIINAGQHRVWGPGSSEIAGNNELSLALVMLIPLIHYFQIIAKEVWVRYSLTIVMLLCTVSILGSYSRGALLAIASMGIFLWIKSKHKIQLALLFIFAIPVMLSFMPEQWTQRMNTIQTYQADRSAMGRFNAWGMAFNLAKDRALGSGFENTTREVFDRYAPDKTDVPRAAHSIYFQVLGEHGFIGLGLYLLLGLMTWWNGNWIIRKTKEIDGYKWASSLASMIQVSLVGFAAGGAFLSLLYWDVPYYLMIALIVTRIIVEKELKEKIKQPLPAENVDSIPRLGGRIPL